MIGRFYGVFQYGSALSSVTETGMAALMIAGQFTGAHSNLPSARFFLVALIPYSPS